MELFGTDRARMVDALLESYDDLVTSRQPCVVVLESPLGWGKTAIIQAFYERLAAERQPVGPAGDPYWPPSIRAGRAGTAAVAPEHGNRHARLARKELHPASDARPQTPPFMWWGVCCTAGEDTIPIQVLGDDITQLEAHIASMVSARALASHGGDVAFRLAKRLAGLFPGLALLAQAPDAISDAVALLRLIKEGHHVARGVADIAIENAERGDLVDRIINLIDEFARREIPFVIALDDAHLADPSVIGLLDAVFKDKKLPVLIVAAAWPDVLERQASRPRTFGQWLKSVNPSTHNLARTTLAPLDDSALAMIVQQAAPETSADVIEALIARADGNPLVLNGLLTNEVVARHTRDNAIRLTSQEIASLPNKWEDLLVEQWQTLPQDIRTVLWLGSLQGLECLREIPTSLAAEMIDLTDADRAVADAINPAGWLRSISGDALRFADRVLFEIGERTQPSLLTPSELTEARRRIIAIVTDARRSPSWAMREENERRLLLRTHVRLASALQRLSHKMQREAQGSARELLTLELGIGNVHGAIPIATALVEFSARLDGHDAPATIELTTELASLHRRAGEYEKGLEIARAAYEDAEAGLAEDDARRVYALNDVACLYCDLGRWEEAVTTGRSVLKDAERILGPDDANTILMAKANVAIYLRCLVERDGLTQEHAPGLREARMIQQECLADGRRALADDGNWPQWEHTLLCELALTEAELEHGPESVPAALATLEYADSILADNQAGAEYYLARAERVLMEAPECAVHHVRLYLALGTNAYNQGKRRLSMNRYRRAVELAEALDDDEAAAVADTLRQLADYLELDGDADTAVRARSLPATTL